jgi:ABC-type uncharacterized transport system permease subunit
MRLARQLTAGASAIGALSVMAFPAHAAADYEAAVGFMVALGLFVGAIGYIIPGLIAWDRGHHEQRKIWIVTIVLGWTGVGWLMALIWALNGPRKVSS